MPAGLHKASIGLLRFGPAALDAAVSASLRQHGCSVHPIDKADDLPSLPHDVLLLLLADRAAADAATLAKIDKCCARKLLIAPRERAFDARLTRSCDDFLLWPSPERELRIRIERLLSSRPQPAPLPACIAADLAGLGLIGNSPSFIATMDVVARFARSNVTVLIEGETGTGKELAARAVHYLGSRKGEPFVPLNCGALPDILLENELFGRSAQEPSWLPWPSTSAGRTCTKRPTRARTGQVKL